jgi:pyridoxine/pyridoxamine 5'-phosphate oxidase
MTGPRTVPDLDELLAEIWDALESGAGSAKDTFHIPIIGTVRDGRPSLRAVVLQRVDRTTGTLGFNTDLRSAKTTDLRASPSISWLFYAPERKLQLRVEGVASLHTDDTVAASAWDAVTPLGRRCYGQLPDPGSDDAPGDLALPGVVLPDFDALRAGDPEVLARCRPNFCAVQCRVTAIEYLYLRYEGHWRARFERSDEDWTARWLAP